MFRLLAHFVAAYLPLAIREIRVDDAPACDVVAGPARGNADAADGDGVLLA
jgi:hypothetical protein